MALSRERFRSQGLFELTGDKPVDLNISDAPLTVWSIPQFEQFQTVFSHGLGQLQQHLNLISTGQFIPGGTSLLTSSMVSMLRAMTKFLQRRYAMMQRLQGLGRVVQTDTSRTWYAQPETAWLRKTIADMKAMCDAFSWVATEICWTSQNIGHLQSSIMGPTTSMTKEKPPKPVLLSYNSFSSIGSEAARDWNQESVEVRNGSDASTPISNHFSDSSSVYSPAPFSTCPSSLNPNTPAEADCKHVGDPSSRTADTQHCEESNSSAFPEYMLSAVLRDLLQLDLRTS